LRRKIKIDVPPPYAPADFIPADVSALQALERGDATPEQQRRALKWIIEQAAMTYDLSYRTDTRDHAFAAGRAFTGQQVVRMLKFNLEAIVKAHEDFMK
jgi:hypothetical protein